MRQPRHLWRTLWLGGARGAALLCTTALLSASPAAQAQTEPDELARRHFDSGAAYFEQAEYEAALREFEKAHELSARPEILLNIATIHERMGNLEAAVSTLDRYLAARPEGNDTIRIRRNNIQKRIEEKGSTPGPAPTAAPPPAAPPPANATPTPKPTPKAAPAPKAAEPAPEAGTGMSRVPAYVLFGVAGATGIASLITGVVANSEYNTLTQLQCATDMNCSTGGARGLAVASTVLTGVAIASGAAGLIWFFIAGDSSEAEQASLKPRVQVGATPDAGFASAHWRF